VRTHCQEDTSEGGLTVYEGRQKDVCLVLQLNLDRVLKDQIALLDYRLDLAKRYSQYILVVLPGAKETAQESAKISVIEHAVKVQVLFRNEQIALQQNVTFHRAVEVCYDALIF
jgi:hypothetical protein